MVEKVTGTSFLDQSQSEVKQNQRYAALLSIQLKIVAYKMEYETTIDKTIVQSWSTYTWRTGEAIVACSSQGAYLLLSEKKTPKQFCLLWGLPQNKTEQPNIVNLQDKTLPKFSFYMINDDLS